MIVTVAIIAATLVLALTAKVGGDTALIVILSIAGVAVPTSILTEKKTAS